MKSKKVIVIGGGAAGFFAAINLKERQPQLTVIIAEQTSEVLKKVKISGGGRCNVTHSCFRPGLLVKNYPRGEKALRQAFNRFQPQDTVQWFEKRNVPLKTEDDGRVFPTSNRSQTIVSCFTEAAERAGVKVWLNCPVLSITQDKNILASAGCPSPFAVHFKDKTEPADFVIVTTGSSPKVWQWLGKLGHSIESPVPSLFTFRVKDDIRLQGLSGISMPEATVRAAGTKLIEKGPLLITHKGLSAPSVLRLSAWGARVLSEKKYHFDLLVNWTAHTRQEVEQQLTETKKIHTKKQILKHPLFELPARLWQSLATAAGIADNAIWAEISKKNFNRLLEELTNGTYKVEGKNTFKDEFVTCGGVRLSQIDFKTMESKLVPRLYFAGEVLDIDAITGGFNFQAAWTTAYIAAHSIDN